MSRFLYRNVLVLTACVNPAGMSFTVLQDKKERERQYIEALYYYLNNVDVPIVFIENSGHDISCLFEEFIKLGRLEFITFNGNSSFDPIKGKGYGEAQMLIYGIERSRFIYKSKYITKITGRLIVQNITRFIHSRLLLNENLWRTNVEESAFTTNVFIARPNTLYNILTRHINEISEINRGNNWIENVLARAFITDNDMKILLVPFTYPPYFDAFSGTSNSKYIIKDCITNTLDNMYFGIRYCKKRGAYLNALFLHIIFIVSVIYNKVSE